MRAADAAALIPNGYRALLAGRTAEGFDDGPSWLRRLPGTLTALCEQWRLTVDGPSRYGHCASAVPVQSPRGPVRVHSGLRPTPPRAHRRTLEP
ncbi:MAG: hypothetical protein M3Y77_19995 [Actinomycetota bacterium]|nr:hypothetical protein [Actinomycetota bacterium]